MAAILHYFTGTGNTARVVDLLEHGLDAAGFAVERRAVGTERPSSEFRLATHVFAFPVYWFALPEVMRRYIRRLPPGGGMGAAVVGTMGGWAGQALDEARGLLERREYHVFLTDVVQHVSNFTQLYEPQPPEEQEARDLAAQAHVAEIVRRLVAGERSLRTTRRVHRIWGAVLGCFFRWFGRHLCAKFFAADARCDGCALCARRCPVQAIRMVRRRPRWTFRCQACQRCLNICPQTAIQSSLVRSLVPLGFIFLPYSAWLRLALPAALVDALGPAGGWPLSGLLWVVGYLAALLVADSILYGLEHVPGLRSVLAFGYTRRWRRYLEPHFGR